MQTRKKEETETQKNKYYLIVYKPDLKFFADYPPGIKIIATSAKWHSLKEQFVIPYILYKNKIKLVHFPYFNVPIFYFGKFIVTIHDLTINKFKTGKATSLPKPIYWLKKLFYFLTIWLAVKKAEKILTVSDGVKQEIVKIYAVDENKVKVICNGCELEEETGKNEGGGNSGDRWNRRSWGKYILYVGNLHPHKNLETLILAYDELIKEKEFENVRLVIVSGFDYFYQKLFEFIQSLNLETKIDFTGLIPNIRLKEYYKNAACFVFPSLSEGFGIPGVEAMNLGCPVIASDIPVFREIYGAAALFFNPKNAVDLKEKIKKLISNNNLHQQLVSAGIIQSKKYSWEKMGMEMVKIYENCISI